MFCLQVWHWADAAEGGGQGEDGEQGYHFCLHGEDRGLESRKESLQEGQAIHSQLWVRQGGAGTFFVQITFFVQCIFPSF